MTYVLAVLSFVIAVVSVRWFWPMRSRRPEEPGFPYVHVNLDGSARELSPEEQRYVSQTYVGGDSGRPYIKTSYEQRDGWGSLSGFLRRRQLPKHIEVQPVHPDYDARVAENPFDEIQLERAAGRIITYNDDGTITSAPDPNLETNVALERERQAFLESLREQERMAQEDYWPK